MKIDLLLRLATYSLGDGKSQSGFPFCLCLTRRYDWYVPISWIPEINVVAFGDIKKSVEQISCYLCYIS